MRPLLLRHLIIASLLLLSSCDGPRSSDTRRKDCSDTTATKCSVLQTVFSPSRDYKGVSKIDGYGGGFGTGYDSADVYVAQVGSSKDDMLILSIEDNADDLSKQNLRIAWPSNDRIEIRYGHGDITFRVAEFAGKTVVAIHDESLDQVAR
jgi:hypothetical protein